MGVHGLWQLLAPCAQPLDKSALAGQRLAVDVSVWFHQAMMGMRDPTGAPLPLAHLHVVFRRLCQLFHWGVQPVFVFDGAAPALKRQTLASRRLSKGRHGRGAEEARKRYLKALVKHAHLSKALDEDIALSLASTSGKDEFQLPSRERMSAEVVAALEEESDFSDDDEALEEFRLERSGVEEKKNPTYFFNLHEIDVKSEKFLELPLDTQHNLLLELGDTRKQSSWQILDEMPARPTSFSSFQVDRLLQRRAFQESLEAVERAIGQETRRNDRDGLWPTLEGGFAAEERRLASDSQLRVIVKGLQRTTGAHLRGLDSSKQPVEEEKEACPARSSSFGCRQRRLEEEVAALRTRPGAIEANRRPLRRMRQQGNRTLPVVPQLDLSDEEESPQESQVSSSNLREEKGREEGGSVCAWIEKVEDNKIALEQRRLVDSGATKAVTSPPPSPVTSPPPSPVTSTSPPPVTSASPPAVTSPPPSPVTSTSPPPVKSPVPPSIPAKDPCARDNDGLGNPSKTMSLLPVRNDEELTAREIDFEKIDSALAKIHGSSCDSLHDQSRGSALEDNAVCTTTGEKMEDTTENVAGSFELPAREEELTAEARRRLHRANVEVVNELTSLAKEGGRQNRLAATMTDRMYSEVQELLDVARVPWMVAPQEAEAQCASLEHAGLVFGSVTDDSDVLLFGCKRVFRHFFHKDKQPMVFTEKAIHGVLGLDRDSLVCIALLAGCDYTDGLKGIGATRARQILKSYPSFEALKQFKRDHRERKLVDPKFLSLELPEGFPSELVRKAFLEPVVDEATCGFEFREPDFEGISAFVKERLGLSEEKVDLHLGPARKGWEGRRKRAGGPRQLTMDGFVEKERTVAGGGKGTGMGAGEKDRRGGAEGKDRRMSAEEKDRRMSAEGKDRRMSTEGKDRRMGAEGKEQGAHSMQSPVRVKTKGEDLRALMAERKRKAAEVLAKERQRSAGKQKRSRLMRNARQPVVRNEAALSEESDVDG
ncbi:unnamed protein product [Cyprideis torosa]|uniref:Uncharacterized protein n=1 Tax=Cyprideis torosa TaxID=163714 RepID=A0A7R8WBM6_9CRUS|nr:unnamed protein product [Cyprideis torosa]CAG0892478.1 unnamed protein product [Cyprideis torosa]